MTFILDGPIDFDRYVEWLAPRIERLPRLRHVVKPSPLHLRLPAWVPAANFDLAKHVVRAQVEPPGDAERLGTLLTELYRRGLPRDRPLWRLFVIEGIEGGRSALLFCAHHCLTDGAGFMEMVKVFFDTPAEGWPEHVHASRENGNRRPDGWVPVRIARTLASREGRARVAAMLRYLRAPGLWFPFSRPVSGRMHFAWWKVPLDEFRAVRAATGGTVTDVAATIFATGLARYAERHGLPVEDRFLRLQLAANVRRKENYGKLGNEVSVVPVIVPLGAMGPLERLRSVVESTRAAKALGMAEFMRGFFDGLFALLTPPGQALFVRILASERFLRLNRRIAGSPRDHTCTTSVVMPPLTYRAQGVPVVSLMPLIPCSADMGLLNVALAYGGHLQFTLAGDAEGIPDLDVLMDHVKAAFAELKAVCMAAPTADLAVN